MARSDRDTEVVFVQSDDIARDESPDTESARRAAATMESMSGTDQVGDGYILIHREEKGTSEHCAKVPADKYLYHDLLEWIRDEFGPGDYRLRLYVRGPKNRFVLAENKLEVLRAPRSREGAASVPVAPATLPGLDPMLVRVLERQQEALDKLAARAESQGQVDVTKIINTISGVATAVTPLLALFVGKQRDSVGELARLIAVTRDVKSLTEDAEPAEQAAPGWGEMLGAVLRGAMSAPRVVPAPAPSPAVVPAVAAIPAPSPAITSAVPASPGPDVALFAAQADALLAAYGADPTADGADRAAAMVCAQIPDAMVGRVLDMLSAPGFMGALFRARPDLLDIADWLVYMRDEMFTILESKTHATSAAHGDTENNPGRGGGDTGHPAGNAPAGA